MTVVVKTSLGNMRRTRRDGQISVQLQCPGCERWGSLDDDQLNGRVSVQCTTEGCGYHETHDFAETLRLWEGRK